MRRGIARAAVVSGGLALLGSPQLASQQAPLRDFDAYVARGVRDWRVPGLAIAVVKDDSVVFLKGYGVRELGKPDPVTVHTPQSANEKSQPSNSRANTEIAGL